VFVNIIDPVGTGIVASLARPGGNTTGFTVFEYGMGGKWLELLNEIAPQVTRVAILRDPALPLALGIGRRYRSLYAGVCWCPAETRTGLLSALANLAVALGQRREEADVEKAARAALRRLAEQRATWLLVYDNVPAPNQIADFLPSAGARVLITTRSRTGASWQLRAARELATAPLARLQPICRGPDLQLSISREPLCLSGSH
jgi:hypothetical protein